MNAFAQATADLHADANLSVLCDYKPRDTPTITGVRIIRSSPVNTFGDFSGGGSVARREQASMPMGAIPVEPKRGDSFAIGRDEFLVEEVNLDPEGAAYVLTLSRSS